MRRYIDADKVMEEIQRIGGHNLCEWHTIGVKALIDRQPTADVVEVRHGEWIGTEYDGYADGNPVYDKWECSKCHEEYCYEGEPPLYNYCPNCGAKMDGERREDDGTTVCK